MSHGIKSEEVILTDLELVSQVLQPSLGGGHMWAHEVHVMGDQQVNGDE